MAARLRKKEEPRRERKRIKHYIRIEIEEVPTIDYSDTEQLKKELRYRRDQEMQYVLITPERVLELSKVQYEFLSESAPNGWIFLAGKRWEVRQALRKLNKTI